MQLKVTIPPVVSSTARRRTKRNLQDGGEKERERQASEKSGIGIMYRVRE